MSRTPTLLALGLLTLTAAAGLAPSGAQAGDYGRGGYSSGHHDRGYARHGYRNNRGHMRSRWFKIRGFGHGRRAHHNDRRW